MDTNMDGKEIVSVVWPWNEHDGKRQITAGVNCGRLYLSASHHGDHDQFWIVQESKTGIGVARHNVRFIETIQWEI